MGYVAKVTKNGVQYTELVPDPTKVNFTFLLFLLKHCIDLKSIDTAECLYGLGFLEMAAMFFCIAVFSEFAPVDKSNSKP